MQATFRRDDPALVVAHFGDHQAFTRAFEPDDLAVSIGEMVPVRLGQVIELVLRATQRASRHGVQQRFPQVGTRAIDECDARLAALAECVAKLRGKFQATRTSADDHDVR